MGPKKWMSTSTTIIMVSAAGKSKEHSQQLLITKKNTISFYNILYFRSISPSNII